jgi:2-haloacid dehalogenase
MNPAIVFDLGGVLIDWNPRHLYRTLFEGDEAAMEAFFDEVGFFDWNLRMDGGRPFAEGVAELVSLHPRHEARIRAFHERWPESVAGAIDGTVEILAKLRALGYPLFALSNWSAETFHHAEARFDFLGWFEGVVLSGRVGVVKPERRIFEAVLELAARPAEQCIFVDDSETNVAAARDLGFDAIRFTTPEALGDDLARRGLLGNDGAG